MNNFLSNMSVKNLYEGSLASISEFQKFDQNLLKEFDTSFSKSYNIQELKNLKNQAI